MYIPILAISLLPETYWRTRSGFHLICLGPFPRLDGCVIGGQKLDLFPISSDASEASSELPESDQRPKNMSEPTFVPCLRQLSGKHPLQDVDAQHIAIAFNWRPGSMWYRNWVVRASMSVGRAKEDIAILL